MEPGTDVAFSIEVTVTNSLTKPHPRNIGWSGTTSVAIGGLLSWMATDTSATFILELPLVDAEFAHLLLSS